MNEQLQSLVEALKEDKGLRTYDEAATKQSVILRVLSLLNWDTYNISEVRPEYPVKKGNVDYALIHDGSCKVFIEVKRVGTELEKHQEQLLELIRRLLKNVKAKTFKYFADSSNDYTSRDCVLWSEYLG